MQQPRPTPFVPPAPVGIPLSAVQSLVPQLATAINDIDMLKAQLSTGNANSTFPNWDDLLQRYTLLLSRVQSLTKFISAPPPKGTDPALAHYLVHPLRALPPDSEQLAQDVLFQAINTQALPLDSPTSVSTGMLGLDTLKGLDDGALQRCTDRLKARLGRESERARAMAREIERRGEEYDWTYRPGEEEEDEKDEEEDDEEEDLFGDEEEEEEEKKKGEVLAPNPRAGWSITDYLAFLENGTVPKVKERESAGEGAAAALGTGPLTTVV
ncbi:hypothetical protein CspHIS471_0408190 [Cutaneotrichosporon sp. HIS471]|nr:hypothetical protein CspHIS471_0408190 [Cutaneotrichosporon sp. HIS471]